MAQMSDKFLLSKTEKLGYLDKLGLSDSESAETSGQNAYCTGFAVHTRLVCLIVIINKLASLEATLVRNYDPLTHSLTY